MWNLNFPFPYIGIVYWEGSCHWANDKQDDQSLEAAPADVATFCSRLNMVFFGATAAARPPVRTVTIASLRYCCSFFLVGSCLPQYYKMVVIVAIVYPFFASILWLVVFMSAFAWLGSLELPDHVIFMYNICIFFFVSACVWRWGTTGEVKEKRKIRDRAAKYVGGL